MALESILVYYAAPEELVPDIQKHFASVHVFRDIVGNDYHADVKPTLPPPEVYQDIDTIICWEIPPNLTSYKQTPKLKFLQVVGSGIEHIASTEFYKSLPAEHPLIVANATGVHVSCISEHVIMSILAFNHKLLPIHQATFGEKRWPSPREFGNGGMFIREIRHQTFGIVGYGHLGREFSRLLKGFGGKVLACTRDGKPKKCGGYILPGTGDVEGTLPDEHHLISPKSDFYNFLSQCDFVISAVPGGHGTKDLFDKEAFKHFKQGAVLINIGRGTVVNTEALIEALESKHLGGAALDVTEPEPLPKDHPLFSFDNVMITPHISWASAAHWARVHEVLFINKDRLDKGLGAINAVRGRGEHD